MAIAKANPGFPVTARIVGGGRYEAFPLYAWFVDRADGPVWQEMDASFEDWNARTGRHVAFFVDPFQRDDWAAEFLGFVLRDGDAVRAVLAARREAQRYFRESLAERACRALWLPQDRLPIVLVGCRWDARMAVAVRISQREDVAKLLELLISVGHRHGPIDRLPPRPIGAEPVWRDRDEEERLRQFEHELTQGGFEHRLTDIRSGMSRFGQELPAEEYEGLFTEWLGSRAPSPAIGAGPHLAGAVTQVALSSFDDLILLARTLVQGVQEVAKRYPGDEQAAEVASFLPVFIDAVRSLHMVRSRLAEIAQTEATTPEQILEDGANEVLRWRSLAPGLSIEARIVDRVGAETYARLQAPSRSALIASETICALSDAISELHQDLSAVLLGYWKASEIEGRKLIVDLITHAGGIPVWNERTGAVEVLQDLARVQRSFTAGNVGLTLVNARFDDSSAWRALPLAPLGERYQQMAAVTRNRFIHRDNLQDVAILSRARRLVAEPPDGILPLAVQCMGHVADAGRGCEDQLPMVVRLLSNLERSNASAAIPGALAGLEGQARGAFAKGAVAKLGERWLLEPRREKQDWVAQLLAAVPRDEATRS